MSFTLRDGWYCQFLKTDLKTPLPRKFTFAILEKVVELAEPWIERARDQAALEHGIQMGRGGIYLHLTPDQYNKLKRG